MKFSNWIKLDEIQHVSFSKPMSINGITTDSIDFRFEDWKQGFNPDKHRDVLAPSASGQRFFTGSFSVPLKSRQWLNVDRERTQTQGNLGVAIALKPQIQISDAAEYASLPGQWFDFAVFYMQNNVVKSPEWPRDKSEIAPNTYTSVELE